MNNSHLEKLADTILSRIRRRPGRPVSIKSLSRSLKIEAGEIRAALTVLKTLGYKIRHRKETITFVAAPDSLIDTEIAYQLATKVIGRRIRAYRSVKSTNDIAAQMAQGGEPEGTIVTAEAQTAGRGRLGRVWHSPAGSGVYVSIILKPSFKPDLAPGLAIMTALALAEAMTVFTKGEVKIKWPNDILIGGRKAAGILTELSAEKNKVEHVIVGVGINVNHRSEDFPAELQKIATSLRIANRRKASRINLLKQFLRNFEKEYRRYQKGQLATSRKRVLRFSSLLGENVELRFGNKTVSGRVVDIDATGALIIEKDGIRRPVTSGEVSVVKA
ncbi:MAG: biotin--[acetyl-CoA-carboxylase] ligase [Candidatus Zixiibacteriota bacterium]|nr:MAG: biotin--[acetyl-CoA-carboxylase] ligase [candidate division Zixibacteria bacterium]